MIIVILNINKIEKERTVEKINETKGWFFEKINKIDKPVVKVPKEKKRKDLNKIRNGRGLITMDTTEMQRII